METSRFATHQSYDMGEENPVRLLRDTARPRSALLVHLGRESRMPHTLSLADSAWANPFDGLVRHELCPARITVLPRLDQIPLNRRIRFKAARVSHDAPLLHGDRGWVHTISYYRRPSKQSHVTVSFRCKEARSNTLFMSISCTWHIPAGRAENQLTATSRTCPSFLINMHTTANAVMGTIE